MFTAVQLYSLLLLLPVTLLEIWRRISYPADNMACASFLGHDEIISDFSESSNLLVYI